MEIVKAKRNRAKMRMGLQGPSGSGKTYSALKIAFGLCGSWEKIVIIDTESSSAHLYSDLGNYEVLELNSPYSPERYSQAIELCQNKGFEVIIIDSISHEWEGIGGVLDIHSNMVGNSFTNWSKVTPRHNSLIQQILQSSAHVISTIRTKTDYVLSEKNGKYVPEKVGLKGITKEGLDYEFTLVLDIDIKHHASSSKDRTGLFVQQSPFIPDEKTGQRIKKWCEMDIAKSQIIEMLNQASNEDEVRQLFEQSGPYKEQLKHLFKDRWNQLILQSQISNGTTTNQ